MKDPQDMLSRRILESIPGYTGYSPPMIQLSLNALDMISMGQMAGAYRLPRNRLLDGNWQTMGELPGRIVFKFAHKRDAVLTKIPVLRNTQGLDEPVLPYFVLGYGAGNVPGTALLIVLLAQSTTLIGQPPPAVLARNSRREALFTPLVLDAIEDIDPELVAASAVLVWDYDDPHLQGQLIESSELVIAAAGDEAINHIGTLIEETNKTRDRKSHIRYHHHGHKVSFSAISREVLKRGLTTLNGAQRLIDVIALLAGLDSIYWDQYGCLSSRVHFIERAQQGHYSPEEYAETLHSQLSVLSEFLPRGSAPRRLLKDSFDRYKLIEGSGQVRVFSEYEDDFLLVVDKRPQDRQSFYSTVNSCMGRVIIVRPVNDLLEVPQQYLKMIPPANLQSLSVAIGTETGSLDERSLQFIDACAGRGVTAIRSLGRAAFPQLAYSWDGLIPLDLVGKRPGGHFTTVEFENAYQQMIETYSLLNRSGRMTQLGGIIQTLSTK